MSAGPEEGERPTHAGGVVWRRREDGALELLLVRPSRGGDEWVLPKGHVEPGEDPRETAEREVREETGVLACAEEPLATVRFRAGSEEVRLEAYLLAHRGETEPQERRERRWVPAAEALELATHDSSRRLLAAALGRLVPRGGGGGLPPVGEAS